MYIKALVLLSILGAAQARVAPKILTFDDIVVPTDDGSYKVMKKYEYGIQEAKRQLARNRRSKYDPPSEPVESGLSKRCDDIDEVQVVSDIKFNNWDVAMSPTLQNIGSSTLIVGVSRGYVIENTIAATATQGWKIIPDVLEASMSITYTRIWQTSDTVTLNFWIPAGQSGVVVSQPLTRRITGNRISGCPEDPKYEPFTADSHYSQTFSNMEWVRGPILLCNNTRYPVPFCVGTGEHR